MWNRLYSSTGKLSSFDFPLKTEELNKKWIRFVNRSDWVPTKHSVLRELHFEEIYKDKRKRMSLNWSMKPVPTIHSVELIDTPSVLLTTQTFRQALKKRIFQEDQLDSFHIHDKINSLDGLNESHSPPGVEFWQFEGCVIFYRLCLTISDHIRVYKNWQGVACPVAI